MYQRQYQKLQHHTTAHLAQTMTLLTMNNAELSQEIERILNENPALDMNSVRKCPQCGRILTSEQICPVCSKPQTMDNEECIVFLSQRSDFYNASDHNTEDMFSHEEISPTNETLSEYVLRQIALDLEVKDRQIAAYLLNLLDEDGLILEDDISTAQYFHTSISRIQNIRDVIKHAEPVGVGSSSPEEAMLMQLEILKESREIPSYTSEIIKNELENLSKKNFGEISRKLSITVDEIKAISDFMVNNLNPYPGRAYWGTVRNPSASMPEVYIKPDVIIQNLNNDPNLPLMVEVILPYVGSLQINSLYKKVIQEANSEKKNELKIDYEKASLFIKCLQQRNNTMQRLMDKITKRQVSFINKGEKYLIPTTRAALAKELNVHESTISRAVANKSIQMPDGRIIPLSKFFDRSLSIRTEIKEIIAGEKENNPLSDTKIVKLLKDRGYEIARRTVAKYRSMEGILPAYLRKKEG